MARTGRRKGSPDTRTRILEAAREAFAASGFDATSVRTIATAAGVDPALIHHYFGTKEQLFLATVDIPADPSVILPAALAGDDEHVGERVVRAFLSVWDDPHTGPPIIALVRSSLAHDWSGRLLREFVTGQILRRIVERLQIPKEESPTRAALVASQMMGLGLTRYVLKVDPLATMPTETVIALVAPTVQHYLTAPLPNPRSP